MPATSDMQSPSYEYVDTSKRENPEMIEIPYLLKQRPKTPNYPINK